RDEVAKLPALRVCGAVYDGVGIPACIASAHRAADEIAREIIATPTRVRGTGSEAGQ
ncbi:protoporphyrinogen oxidase, partial [Streptomyces sp. SID7982]|nr:protoporphyrinogen oxidase [Streptomyces sp. SID7982]